MNDPYATSDKHATLEIIAPSVEEAVEQGLSDLGLPREAVDIEVLDHGNRGLFGLGSRQARIRLVIKGALESGTRSREASSSEGLSPYVQDQSQPEATFEGGEAEDEVLRTARQVVSELLEKMKVEAQITTHYGEPDELKGRVPVLVDVRGDDLNILIGRRSETLNALQYVASLIICKQLARPITLVIDLEGYRSRRAGQLRQLAHRMADQALKTGRRQVLEPMPANERRVVHMELREHPQVTTESVGEEPHRKVTIIPKE
jgi:spoIIIJ-associated protein